jgi:hypothetical protein
MRSLQNRSKSMTRSGISALKILRDGLPRWKRVCAVCVCVCVCVRVCVRACVVFAFYSDELVVDVETGIVTLYMYFKL